MSCRPPAPLPPSSPVLAATGNAVGHPRAEHPTNLADPPGHVGNFNFPSTGSAALSVTTGHSCRLQPTVAGKDRRAPSRPEKKGASRTSSLSVESG